MSAAALPAPCKIPRLGPREKEILLRLNAETFTPPSTYMGRDYGSCPSGHTLNRLVRDKKLAIFQFMTWTPEEWKNIRDDLPPGYLTAERNAALKLTDAGAAIVARLREAEDKQAAS